MCSGAYILYMAGELTFYSTTTAKKPHIHSAYCSGACLHASSSKNWRSKKNLLDVLLVLLSTYTETGAVMLSPGTTVH